MLLPLAAALVALSASQAGGAVPPGSQEPEPEPAATPGTGDAPAGSPEASRPGSVEMDGAGQWAGIPFLPSLAAGGAPRQGAALELGVLSLLRGQTIGGTEDAATWGWDAEVTPGLALAVTTPLFDLGAGYAVRLSIPIDSAGASFAALQRGFARVDWRVDPVWTLSADAAGTYGDYSQIQPVATPGGPGSPPPALNPVRTFETYPYLALYGTLRVAAQVSPRSRLRASAGYQDVGGIGEVGAAAQPRTWGPLAGAAFEWDASRHALLTTAASYQDSILTGAFAIQIGTLTETWRQQWTPDLETTASAGAALSSTDSNTFLGFGHLLPVASAGVAYHTDVRHSVKLGLDLALAPYVDTALRLAYQRATARAAVDWRPAANVLLGLYVAGAIVPYSVGAPDAYGTAGASLGWAPAPFLTVTAGGFTQSQLQGQSSIGGFRQWTAYLGVAFQDRESL